MPQAAAAETHARFSPEFLAHVAELAALAAGPTPGDYPTVRDCGVCRARDAELHEFELEFGGEMHARMRMATLQNPAYA